MAPPRDAPGQSRRAQRARRALHEAGSVPCTVARSRASSISPPAIDTERDASAGRCGAVWGCRAGRSRGAEVLRQRRARAAQAAHGPWAAAPPMALWHGSVAADRRPARRPPSVKYVPMRNGAAASPTASRTARRGPHAGAPRRGRAFGKFYYTLYICPDSNQRRYRTIEPSCVHTSEFSLYLFFRLSLEF